MLKEAGKSTLGAMKIWMDAVSGRLNTDERGLFLGAFDTGDQLMAVYKDGSYEMMELDLNKKFEPKELFHIGRYTNDTVVSAVYFDGERGWTLVKRFQVETSKTDQRFPFITEHKQSKLYFASADEQPILHYKVRTKNGSEEKQVDLADFIDVKGWKSVGNKLEDGKITSAKGEAPKKKKPAAKAKAAKGKTPEAGNEKLQAGDSIDFDLEDNGQTKMF